MHRERVLGFTDTSEASVMAQLDLWADEVAALPWGGRSPRALARIVVQKKIGLRVELLGTCVVDNSVVRCPRREPPEVLERSDRAQLQCFISDGAPSVVKS